MAGDAAERETKPHARLDSEAGLHLDRLKSNVIGILKHRDAAGPIESDIEFARQAIQRTLIENVEVPLARIRARIDQFIRIDAGRRRARHVPDVVGTGPSRAQAEILDRLHDIHCILRLDLTHLQICAGRDVRITAGELFGDVRKTRKLPVLQNAVRDAQSAHV